MYAVVDVRSLLNGHIRKYAMSEEMKLCFEAWKERMQENNQPLTMEDCFYAGYILSNPVIRDNLMKIKKAEKLSK